LRSRLRTSNTAAKKMTNSNDVKIIFSPTVV
jgi:hypothetical protein